MTTHQIDPPKTGDSGITLCCGINPMELPRDDRLTWNPTLVTCQGQTALAADEQTALLESIGATSLANVVPGTTFATPLTDGRMRVNWLGIAIIIGNPDIAYRVREYLLGTPQVERAAYSMYLERPLELDQDGSDDWAILPDEWKQEWLDSAREALTGALAIEGVVRVPGVEQPPSTHEEHVTVSWAYKLDCLEGTCKHVDEDGQPEDLSACPTVPPFEVCVDCMDDNGHGRDPEQWDDVPLTAWPHETTTTLAAEPLTKP